MSDTATFTTEMCKRLANYTMGQVSSAKLIVNNVAQPVTIEKKEVVNDTRLNIYVGLDLQTTDVLNGIELYDSSGVLLVRTSLNVNYIIQQATYLFQIDFYSDYIMASVNLFSRGLK